MFGVYRTILALIVVFHHLLKIPLIGHYAVHGFFILSGYLMTYIMHNTYGYSFKGKITFAKNRFLRLYPSYWIILVTSIFIILFFGEQFSQQFRGTMYLPNSIKSIVQNFSLIYLDIFPSKVSPRVSPPTWALTVELFYYFLIALGVSRTKRITLIWVFMSVLYYILTYYLGYGYAYRYSIVFAGSLPFSIGALIYHFKDELKNLVERYKIIFNSFTMFFLLAISMLLGVFLKKNNLSLLLDASVYFNYIVNGLLIIYLIQGKLPFISKKIDKKIGDYSYPIYLFHWQAGFFVSMIVWNKPIVNSGYESLINTLLAIIITIVISWLIIKFIDEPIEKIRKNFKVSKYQ